RHVSFKIINSPTLLLPCWRETTAGTSFKNRTLPRDVATCWNSTYDMLKAFLEMKELVKAFLDCASYGLSAYALSEKEWQAINDLVSALKAQFFFSCWLFLHPSFKLEYFKTLQWPQEWINDAINVTQKAWTTRFKPTQTSSDTKSSATVPPVC
ncbi:hypothetical protein BT96DRAFT_813986, partial [Gymnopus androsaceus JB14]